MGATTTASGGSRGGGTATGAGTRVDVTLKLSQLQNLCKRDPVGYRDDYDAQVRRLESECGILKLGSSATTAAVAATATGGAVSIPTAAGTGTSQGPSSRLIELIQFAAAVSSSSYKGKESDRIAQMLIDLLVGTNSSTNDDDDNNDNVSTNNKAQRQQRNIASISMTMPTSALQLHREVRKTCVSALILMRNKGTIEPLRLLELFFRLMSIIPDKGLRELLYKHMVNDIRNINKKGKRDDKVNRSIQSFLHRIVSTHGQQQQHGGGGSNGQPQHQEDSATDIAAKRATDMVCELYRRQVWTDEKTVAIVATAVTSSNTTVMARAMRFFLNIEEKMYHDQKVQEEDEWDAAQKVDFHRFSRKTNNRQRHVERQLKQRKRQQKKREGTSTDDWMDIRDDQGVESSKKLYPAIELLRNPQGLAEHVLKRLRAPKSVPYKLKLLMMNFVTRLVGNHELLLLNLYPFLQKYMSGHQQDVTAVLAYTVQACHDTVPPEEVYAILKTIAHNFVTERCSEEQMAVGINAIRAICTRVPTVLSIEESKQSSELGSANDGTGGMTSSASFDVEAFVRDIAGFANHRDRSVSIAGKAYMNFIRDTAPSLLQGKHRGLKGSALHKYQQKLIKAMGGGSGAAGTTSSKKNRDGQMADMSSSNMTTTTTSSEQAQVAPAIAMRYGQHKAASGVAGADLLVEYESKKAAYLLKRKLKKLKLKGKRQSHTESNDNDDNDDEDENDGEDENVEIEGEDEWEEVEGDDGEEDGDDEDDDEEEVIPMKDDKEEMENKKEENEGSDKDADDDDDEAPDLVVVDPASTTTTKDDNNNENEIEMMKVIDLSTMTIQQREELKQHVSATRIFSTSDFAKMRKLLQREERLKHDPREAARRKRAMMMNKRKQQKQEQRQQQLEGSDDENDDDDDDDDEGFDFLTDDEEDSDDDEKGGDDVSSGFGMVDGNDSDDDSDDDEIRISGAVNPSDIMAAATRKRQSKADKLQKVLDGRTKKFEHNQRLGGSTNTEKQRRKNFLMSKSSHQARSKGRGKNGLSSNSSINNNNKRRRRGNGNKMQMGHEAKKRRRKM